MFPEVIETERLRLEPVHEALDPLAAYEHYAASRSDTVAEETRYLSWSPHETPKESWDVHDDFAEQWAEAEGAVYAVFPREGEEGAGEFAGTAGLHLEWERRTAVFGIWLRKPFWGRGYSGERAMAFMDVAFDRLDLELVAVACLPGNEQSRRAIEKYVDRAGGQYEGHLRNRIVDQDDAVHDVHRYSVTREQWLEADTPTPRYPAE